MKSQIFAGIALLVAGIYTVEHNKDKNTVMPVKEVKVLTTQQIIENSSLNKKMNEIEERQDSVSLMVREQIQDRVIDSQIVVKDSLIDTK